HPVSPYALNALENLINVINAKDCTAVPLEHVLQVVQSAMRYEGTQASLPYFGFLQRLQGQLQIMMGDYINGAQSMFAAYNNSKVVSILVELVNIQIELGRLEDAKYMLGQLEKLNDMAFGTESYK